MIVDKRSLTSYLEFAILQVLPLNNTRFASAGLGRISAPRRVTYFRGLNPLCQYDKPLFSVQQNMTRIVSQNIDDWGSS
jgi:hypothetical protein